MARQGIVRCTTIENDLSMHHRYEVRLFIHQLHRAHLTFVLHDT